MAVFHTRQRQDSGVPLGGLGTGSVELRPDGEFHAWQIANPERWRQDCRKRPEADDGESLSGSLSFYLRTQTASGGVLLRRLGLGVGKEEYNYRMYSFLKPVEEVCFQGTFPTVSLDYADRALPVEVSLKAAAPFVPYEERAAGTPGAYLTFTLRNPTREPVEVSLAGKLRSIADPGPGGRGRRSCLIRERGYTALLSSGASDGQETPAAGAAALSVEDPAATWLCGEYRGYMDEYVAHGEMGVSEESFLFGFRRTGRLPCLSTAQRPDWGAELDRLDLLSDPEAGDLLEQLDRCGFASSILERLRLVQPECLERPAERREALRYVLKNWRELDRDTPWGDGALCSAFRLAPGETREVRFILAWYFPCLYSAEGCRVGHMYENWFSGAEAVLRYLHQERSRILEAVSRFQETLYDSSFPEVFSDTVSAQLSTLIKCSWWSAEGDFGIWEGLGSCGLHTTDVAYHGSWSLAALFPALEQRQMRMTAAFQRADGRIPHFFTPDFHSVDNGFDRVDMNPQFVLLVCRDYLTAGDRAYAEELWPSVVRAMEQTASLDSDGDGLPDRDTGRNTYDAWRFSGASAYLSILWLAALEAGAVLADALGKPEQARVWRGLEARGAASLEGLLWNGGCYDLWADGDRRDQCCMTAQLDGACFCRLLGLRDILPAQRVRPALDAIWNSCFSQENGLVNASCLPGKHATLHTFRNCQGLSNWSGIEYLMASFFLMTGQYERGLRIVETVWERHLRLGRVWDHAECGDHYYRPLSSWTLLQALTGVSVHGASRTLMLAEAPCAGDFHGPWFASAGYGTVHGAQGSRRLICLWGQVPLERIVPPAGTTLTTAAYNARPFSLHTDGTSFPPITLQKGDSLEVSFR